MSARPMPRQETLVLDYDLMDLPTAQHKAGLAGLLLHLRSFEEREVPGGPVLERLDPFGATVRVSRDSLQCLFDDLYAATWEEIQSRTRYQGKAPLREETVEVERDGKKGTEKRYIYPDGRVLAHWLSKGKDDPWLKLWQNMLWSVLRAQPKSRGEFQNRADGQPVGFVDKLWQSLLKAEKKRRKGGFETDSITGSLFVGAQDKNAERVAFVGRVEHNLLLHFWQWATPIFVPRAVDPRKGSWDYQGFLLAIPEVADLETFTGEMRRFWLAREPDISGYRPTEALVDFPAEGGLEFLYHLVHRDLDKTDLLDSVHAVELYHQLKQGKNVRQLTAERLLPDPGVLRRYVGLRDRLAHPLFKQLLIGNLLRDQPWHRNAERLFCRYPVEFFIQLPNSPRTRFFGRDVDKRFKQAIQDLEQKEQAMVANDDDKPLERLIYRLIRSYVDSRARDRARIDDGRKFEDLPAAQKDKYRESKPKVASTAFLALRGRHGQDITEYFTGTLCAAGHYLPEADYLLLSQALLRDPEKVKSLTMLALSAHSRKPRDKTPGNDATDTSNA